MKFAVVFYTCFVLVHSCNHSSKPANQTPEDMQSQAGTMDSLSLDNGSKWHVDTFATNGIRRMQTILNSFCTKTQNPTQRQYKDLSGELQGEYNLIYQECPMVPSPAHTQLHIYLMSIQIHLNTLQQNDPHKSAISVQFLKGYLDEFHTYFE